MTTVELPGGSFQITATLEVKALGTVVAPPRPPAASGPTQSEASRSARSAAIPDHTELIPQAVVFTVAEVAVWLGWMPYGEPIKSKVYNAATERVRGLIQRGELPARVIGGKSYVVSGFALREYLDGADAPITAAGV